ncbi:phosphate ABC transporter permease PstA [Elioraea sp.]|jgi:phosphate transport system permease protein|uniref:phosphate ABC transporter permease PstA n=1 Tax=Elioraea sp. TaxID=2185103 RepID=UPI0021DD7BF2|nr:phosphate ABC transporter permease PstA [Elioraea sp.]GIX10887.1 MAG: phosphate transport system permease protein PstA [Elioraea sp.]
MAMDAVTSDAARTGIGSRQVAVPRRGAGGQVRLADLSAQGEPWLWCLGGALALGIVMILGFLVLVFWNGIVTFWPKPIEVVRLTDGSTIAGLPTRSARFRVGDQVLAVLPDERRAAIAADGGFADRTLYRVGNYDLYGEDFRWAAEFEVVDRSRPADLVLVERLEWGVFVGRIASFTRGGETVRVDDPTSRALAEAWRAARARWHEIRRIEKGEIGTVNHHLEQERLRLRRALLEHPEGGPAAEAARARFAEREAHYQAQYEALAARAQALKAQHEAETVTLVDINGREKVQPLGTLVRYHAANQLTLLGKLDVYLSRWAEFLTDEPREANTEGGIMPAIFGTVAMTLLLVIAVTPFGVITALYLREYARQGRLVSIVRISVNNLAGVPSIVYGVFGLGFFAYIVGGSIDQLFYPERLPSPTFGTGGLLWASLTLALLTVPVVIVATEEALAAVPRSMREGSLACGASKWQTIRNIVLPRALPGIMTGIILAMARGAGEVAPLMLVGVVKLAPELPIDGFFPFIHLERSFMHLGFHIYDVGFQSRNSEAGKPMVFVTTLLLIALIFAMNLTAIIVRTRLKRKFAGSQF